MPIDKNTRLARLRRVPARARPDGTVFVTRPRKTAFAQAREAATEPGSARREPAPAGGER